MAVTKNTLIWSLPLQVQEEIMEDVSLQLVQGEGFVMDSLELSVALGCARNSKLTDLEEIINVNKYIKKIKLL